MACRSPMVSFCLKEAKYSARDAALYVTNNDVKALARGIVRLIDNPSLSKKMADIGYQRVSRYLSWQQQGKKLLKAYTSL